MLFSTDILDDFVINVDNFDDDEIKFIKILTMDFLGAPEFSHFLLASRRQVLKSFW